MKYYNDDRERATDMPKVPKKRISIFNPLMAIFIIVIMASIFL
jgi:hypothetical protein